MKPSTAAQPRDQVSCSVASRSWSIYRQGITGTTFPLVMEFSWQRTSEGLCAVLTPGVGHLAVWAILLVLICGAALIGYLGTRTFTRRSARKYRTCRNCCYP